MPKAIEIIGAWRRCQYVIEEQNGVPVIVSISKSKIKYYNPMEISPLSVQPEFAEIHHENSPSPGITSFGYSQSKCYFGFCKQLGASWIKVYREL